MPIEVRRHCLTAIRERYKKAPKKEKTKILDEFCATCGYKSRKHAIAILSGRIEPKTKKPGPKALYDRHFEFHLVQLWKAMGYMCSKKMVVALPIWLKHYRDPTYYSKIEEKLLTVSAATIDRLLKKHRTEPRRGISATKAGHLLKNQIPIDLHKGNVDQPGYVEADTVAHCGTSLSGSFGNSLTVTDLYSCWTENRAVWRKEADAVKDAFIDIEHSLPFYISRLSTDNGYEFLNHAFVDYCKTRKGGAIKFTRKRPYKKNDAAHVEQKNWTHVRQLFGYSRVDDPAIVVVMNEIYRAYWSPLMNYFNPVMKIIEKKRVGAKIKKKYDRPKTPYQRLMESEHISSAVKSRLKKNYMAMNPFDLKQRMEKKMSEFKKLVQIDELHNDEEKSTA